MAKVKTHFVCQSCGYRSAKWLGRCPDCATWNSLVEEQLVETPEAKGRGWGLSADQPPMPITEIEAQEGERLKTRIEEFDRVLGGGIVAGSIVLIGGDPGIGKSTLLLQVSDRLSREGLKVLYVSGEESPRQTKIRGERLGIRGANVLVLSETSLEKILNDITKHNPAVLVIDSIQAVFTSELQSPPGSISQVRDSSARLMQLAKGTGIPIFLIGHVTKEGAIAGPRVVEHMVDTVLYFEGEKSCLFRILRAVKNRFGSSNEIGVFQMEERGLLEVENPSVLFLPERAAEVSGSVVVCCVEGTRPLLLELQALVSPSSYGTPQRVSSGVDYKRLALLLAILEKREGLSAAAYDVFVNMAGGVRVDEPAVDLGVMVALASSLKEVPTPRDSVVIGEVGLGGEVRAVGQIERRIKEAEKLGFRRCVVPHSNLKGLNQKFGIEIIGVKNISQTIKLTLT
jgi:DNA repair protein RadA/Sms